MKAYLAAALIGAGAGWVIFDELVTQDTVFEKIWMDEMVCPAPMPEPRVVRECFVPSGQDLTPVPAIYETRPDIRMLWASAAMWEEA